MDHAPKTKSPWRYLRRLLIVVAILATLIGILYTEEDVRGKIEWDNYRHTLEARGEKLEAQDFVPPAVPDDENFFTAPFFLSKGESSVSIYGKNVNTPTPNMGYWAEAKMTDLTKWQAYYRNLPDEFPTAAQAQTSAADALLALSKYDSAIADLREANQRPYANVPIHYDNLFMVASDVIPYMAALKRSAQVLELRAIAELANGQSARAGDDVKLMFRLGDSIQNQPLLISHMVRVALLQLTLQPIWEGTINHEWTDAQLAEIEAELARLDFLVDYQFAVRGERVFAIQTFENQRITHKYEYIDDSGATNSVYYTLMPAAFFYQNELAIARLDQEWALPLVDTNAHTASPEKLQWANDQVQKGSGPFPAYKTLALSTFAAVGSSMRRFAFTQSAVDLARVACALERYHLAHGQYPDFLTTLAPQYLESVPNDVIGGEPLHYQRTADGKFLLYSVGWNQTDEGGKTALSKAGHNDITKGDWVWPVTAK